MFQTEFEFILPLGYADSEGNLHRKGVMRLATAVVATIARTPRPGAGSEGSTYTPAATAGSRAPTR